MPQNPLFQHLMQGGGAAGVAGPSAAPIMQNFSQLAGEAVKSLPGAGRPGQPNRPGGGDHRTFPPGQPSIYPVPPRVGPSAGGSVTRPPGTGVPSDEAGRPSPPFQMPWQIWQARIKGSDWFVNGESPPAAMIQHLQAGDRPALMRAIQADPDLLRLFQPFLDTRG